MDFINIINLDTNQIAQSVSPIIKSEEIIRSREERVLSVARQSKQYGFPVKFWEGIIDPRGGQFGIALSFKKIVEWAQQENLPYLIIAEDDILFSSPGAWNYYLEQMPADFDIYSGGIYSGQIKDGRIVNGYSGNTLITIHQTFYKTFIGACDEAIANKDQLDRRLGHYAFERNYKIVQPYVVRQLEGYSDNHRRRTSHTGYLEEMKSKLFIG